MTEAAADLEQFLKLATWHGPIDQARAMLAANPALPAASIHAAAVVGNADLVRGFLTRDPASVSALAEPFLGMPLVYLSLSRFLRLDPSRSDAFLRCATVLLDAGADPNGGFWTPAPQPEFETPLYGAAGVAHHAGLTRLLLERGADPNDGEVAYHSPESYDLAAMQVVVETGRLTPDSLALMLIRKCDWHDLDGIRYLLGKGADPNQRWTEDGHAAILHAIERDNSLAIIETLLDHGADPTMARGGVSGVARAAQRGRGDILNLFQQRGVSLELNGVDRLIAACARNDGADIARITSQSPELLDQLRAEGGELLTHFAGTANSAGVERLLDLGIPTDASTRGDGYFGIAPGSTALHVASWRAWHKTVKTLLARGAPVNLTNSRGETALMLAVKACVDSYWMERRTTESVAALLAAGATTDGVLFPSGYEEADRLIAAAR
jgi:ankyrin repeat protein